MTRLLNASVMPAEGIYKQVKITTDVFVEELTRANKEGTLISYVGYEQTASFIEQLAGIPIPLNRDPTPLVSGDTLLICRLKYRVVNPATKGKWQEEDFEFLRCEYSE